jgi:hypothetical protein
MHNRFLSILILIWVFWFWYIFYQLEIKPEKIKKAEQVKIELENQKILEEKKEEEEVSLIQIESIKKEENIDNNIADKIEELKNKNNSYKSFELDSLWLFYFNELDNEKLWLFHSEKKLWKYEKVEKIDLDIKETIANNDYIYIRIWKDKYLYNLKTNNIVDIDLKLEVEYIKSWQNSKEFLFKTNVWTFVYLLDKNKFDYFNLFTDFIYYNNWYLWIIKKDDEVRFKNFNLDYINKDLIIYHDLKTKERKIIYQTELDLNKIYKQNTKIYFEDIEWGEYELENIN